MNDSFNKHSIGYHLSSHFVYYKIFALHLFDIYNEANLFYVDVDRGSIKYDCLFIWFNNRRL